jgi:hypothetical protein
MKRADLIRHLEAHGCQLLRECGKDPVYVNLANRQRNSEWFPGLAYIHPKDRRTIKETGSLFRQIQSAVADDRFLVSWHADERCEERGVSAWQLVSGLADARRSKPNPSVVVREELADGTAVEAIWSWHAEARQAVLVTVYFKH